jgi:hypothetical protein
MKKSELQQIIREEIQNIVDKNKPLNESIDPEILKNLFIGLQIATVGAAIAYRDISSGSDSIFRDWWSKIKNKWDAYKYKKNVQPIVDRLKKDKDIQEFFKQPISKQRTGWTNLLNLKLLDNEKQYLKQIYKKNLKQ